MPRTRKGACGSIDTFVLTNSWVFVKISTDAGITGWGEMLKDDAKACAAGALEVGDYLIIEGAPPRDSLDKKVLVRKVTRPATDKRPAWEWAGNVR